MNSHQERTKTDIGDLSGVMALFDKARQHLARPAIVLQGEGAELRLSLAGQGARVPDSLNVATNQGYGSSKWFGRILQDGVFEASPREPTPPWLVGLLQRFAADPAKVAAESGHMTGKCCFCSRPLSDELSTAIGYGKKCAENFSVPWGKGAIGRPRKGDLFADGG